MVEAFEKTDDVTKTFGTGWRVERVLDPVDATGNASTLLGWKVTLLKSPYFWGRCCLIPVGVSEEAVAAVSLAGLGRP